MDDWMRRYRVRSTVMMLAGIAMLIWVTAWGMSFADTSPRSGAEIALITAAIQVPATYYAAFAFRIYSETKLP